MSSDACEAEVPGVGKALQLRAWGRRARRVSAAGDRRSAPLWLVEKIETDPSGVRGRLSIIFRISQSLDIIV